MPKLQYDIASDPAGPVATAPAPSPAPAPADADIHAALRRLAEICIEAHGIVAREGPAEVRRPLEVLLGRIGHQLGSRPRDEAEAGIEAGIEAAGR